MFDWAAYWERGGFATKIKAYIFNLQRCSRTDQMTPDLSKRVVPMDGYAKDR